jgi:hypothetical protein
VALITLEGISGYFARSSLIIGLKDPFHGLWEIHREGIDHAVILEHFESIWAGFSLNAMARDKLWRILERVSTQTFLSDYSML